MLSCPQSNTAVDHSRSGLYVLMYVGGRPMMAFSWRQFLQSSQMSVVHLSFVDAQTRKLALTPLNIDQIL